MSSHHDHHNLHSNEPKKVAFATPLILGLVTMLAILLLVSLGDQKQECCEGQTNGTHHEAAHGSQKDHHDPESHDHSATHGEAAEVHSSEHEGSSH